MFDLNAALFNLNAALFRPVYIIGFFIAHILFNNIVTESGVDSSCSTSSLKNSCSISTKMAR